MTNLHDKIVQRVHHTGFDRHDYQTVVQNVHGELVKELRGDVVVTILQFYNNTSSPVSMPYFKPDAKVFRWRLGPNRKQTKQMDM